jgi:phage gp36-like protein
MLILFRRTAPANETIDPQIIYYYMDSIVKFADIKRTSLNQVNTRYSDSVRFDKDFADGGCGFGIGIAYDRVSDQGVDFRNVNFGLNMSLDLTTDSPQAFYLFVHNKNTLVFGPGGLQVMA